MNAPEAPGVNLKAEGGCRHGRLGVRHHVGREQHLGLQREHQSDSGDVGHGEDANQLEEPPTDFMIISPARRDFGPCLNSLPMLPSEQTSVFESHWSQIDPKQPVKFDRQRLHSDLLVFFTFPFLHLSRMANQRF